IKFMPLLGEMQLRTFSLDSRDIGNMNSVEVFPLIKVGSKEVSCPEQISRKELASCDEIGGEPGYEEVEEEYTGAGGDGEKTNIDVCITFCDDADGCICSENCTIQGHIAQGQDCGELICQRFSDDGLCDALDIAYGEGYEQMCCDNYALCC
ncbi:MAG: hypothetical protein ABIB71_04135, partial [Candidatus Woesearchaeota archaeon]